MASQPDNSEFDWGEALAAVNGDADLLKDVVEVLIDDLPRLRTNMNEAAQAKDADALRRAAHSLKGSLRFLGDIPSFQMAQEIESLCAREKLDEVEKIMPVLDNELDSLEPELKKRTGS